MRTENSDFDFGYKPLPEGLLKPTARKAYHRYSVIIWTVIGTLVMFSGWVGMTVWWSSVQGTEKPEELWVEKHDPIEDDPKIRPILEAVDLEIKRIIATDPPEVRHQLGYCHGVWGLKKSILRDRYGINWRTPAEMNPKIAFD
jgi:hypothetical protein